MYKIYCLNNISPEGLALLTDNYEVTENIDEADAILVRSADMHEMEVPANLKAVARAGAGVNNIPLDKFAEAEDNCAKMAVEEVMAYLERGEKIHCVNM